MPCGTADTVDVLKLMACKLRDPTCIQGPAANSTIKSDPRPVFEARPVSRLGFYSRIYGILVNLRRNATKLPVANKCVWCKNCDIEHRRSLVIHQASIY